MKNQWLNLVLVLTNRIYVRKQQVVGQTGLTAAYNIIVLIAFEIILGVISLPLYLGTRPAGVTAFFAEKGTYEKIAFDYNLRRILTLTGVGIIAAIWTLKLLLILLLPRVYGPLQLYSVTDFRPADILSKELVAAETGLQTARMILSIPRPELTGVDKISGGDYVFYGKGQPNSTVVLLLSDQQTAIYTANTDNNGDWKITQLKKNFKLNEGNHSVLVFTYDNKLGVRSDTAPEQYFKVTTSWADSLVKNVDVLANWSVVLILLVGVFVTFLTI